jgi:hypothetical protein
VPIAGIASASKSGGGSPTASPAGSASGLDLSGLRASFEGGLSPLLY